MKMNLDYIAGFFDGEGSAMIITIRRRLRTGLIYRFRPVVKIAQKQRPVLDAIQKFLGFGHVDERSNRPASAAQFIINGLEGVQRFVDLVASRCFIKRHALRCLGELVQFQRDKMRHNFPYSREEIVKMLDIRDGIFQFNAGNRSFIQQKYSRERVLQETVFQDPEVWKEERERKRRIQHASYYRLAIKTQEAKL